MFKRIIVAVALIAVVGALVFGAINRTQANTGSESVTVSQGVQGRGRGGNGSGGGGGNGSGEELIALLPATPGELSAEESAALIYLREEEKLAHDVYVTLYSKWGQPTFQNIGQSEQTHTDTVKSLLDRYGLSDPAANAVGVFTNPDLQALYQDLIARGSRSLAEALKVGATVEEIDILDLKTKLTQTDNADIQQVFNSLMSGSYNHIRSFTGILKTQTGEVYQPQYLSNEVYQTIINTGTNGNSRGGRGGK